MSLATPERPSHAEPHDDEADDMMVSHGLLVLSPELDQSISTIVQSKDPLDHSEFNPVSYINELFPNEQALSSIDDVLKRLRSKTKKLDREIKELLHSQVNDNQTRVDLEETKQAIMTLYDRIKKIKEKAASSEKTVHEITKDIKSLDQAKQNITFSITVLRRLQMLVSTIDQLRVMILKKRYAEAAQLLQVMLQLLEHFRGYKSIGQILSLYDIINQLQIDLRRQIVNDFESAFVGGALRTMKVTLNDACLVLDVLEGDARKQIIDWYCELQLKDYRAIFKANPEVGSLDNVSRRYAWLKRLLKTYDEEHSSVFIPAWKVAETLSLKFCQETKKQLSDVLLRADAVSDVKILLSAIHVTIDFEAKLEKRFSGSIEDTLQAMMDDSETLQSTAASPFYKAISLCFEPYLKHYIDYEDANLRGMMEGYKSSDLSSEEDTVLASSTDLFYYYRQTLVQCSKYSVRKPFLDLARLFSKYLRIYADYLTAKMQRDEKKVLTNEDIRIIATIINTADYCSSTTSQLEEKLVEKIDDEFKTMISMSGESDAFVTVTGTAMRILIRGFENSIEPALVAMSKRNWGTLESVGDQSEYVTQIGNVLSASAAVLRSSLSGQKYFRTFCDKFSDSLLQKFNNNIFKCKPINEVGAEQMLLDTYALKTILLHIATIGNDPDVQPPATYIKLLGKGVSKVEQLLKVVLSSHEPMEGLVETYLLLFGDYNVGNFQKVLELKGLKRAEQQSIVEYFQTRIPVGSAQTMSTIGVASANSPNPFQMNAGAAGKNIKEGFEKLVAGINITKRS
ncbi:Vps53-like protein [Polychytrium aggregatum]|uniref:Vps53-like protein n=1 Tax=Polychytrium aggregatum TaxID=110093 RepID=UPI0022FF2487|nr:Vps53-like protein [Polychytrium aggregatum]KAI9208319.1 Vps53-like protein [Polychytrium aggregatum]